MLVLNSKPSRKSSMSLAIPYDSITDWSQTNGNIASQLGCCVRSVRNARNARGLPKALDKSKRSWLKEKLPLISDRAWRQNSNLSIAHILNCSKSAVRVFRLNYYKPVYERKTK